MPRIFTGLEVPETMADDLSRLQGGLGSARWIDPEDFHITLRFIGDVGERAANDIADMLYAVRKRSIEVTLTGLGSFGGDKPRSLYIAVKPSQPLMELQAEHERIMRRVGLEPETRKFTPHVTLARLGRNARARDVADWIALRGLFMSRTFLVPHFVLFSAKESVGGGPYLVEETYPLAA
ncbi:RNA 2',3'-cyclic phosphodiesterase [Phreatobacter stygius]|uniref:RNA 2',3'-cyclic phosphodiesterase n=1 Tax=Phreatobacter stygius TaxID=1940610 RepID=A0A4D7B976_9HYPH|nr:RNA 2',3'-cyclic phosphodiesterase [Phreatobacter stygius]QCI64657.1 RNA 2',3'-cyclic phosphodiesterase [Phreatobacter stygius]